MAATASALSCGGPGRVLASTSLNLQMKMLRSNSYRMCLTVNSSRSCPCRNENRMPRVGTKGSSRTKAPNTCLGGLIESRSLLRFTLHLNITLICWLGMAISPPSCDRRKGTGVAQEVSRNDSRPPRIPNIRASDIVATSDPDSKPFEYRPHASLSAVCGDPVHVRCPCGLHPPIHPAAHRPPRRE